MMKTNEGTEREFEYFVAEYRRPIAKICAAYVGGANDFGDLCREELIDLWCGFGRFEGR